jgi:hypothetical protein
MMDYMVVFGTLLLLAQQNRCLIITNSHTRSLEGNVRGDDMRNAR